MKKLIRDTVIVVFLTYVLYFGFIFSDRKASELAITLLCLFFFIAFVICRTLRVWFITVCIALSAFSFSFIINPHLAQPNIRMLGFFFFFAFLTPTIIFPAVLLPIFKSKIGDKKPDLFRFPAPAKWVALMLILEFTLIVLPITLSRYF